MQINARELGPSAVIAADVCIVGGGPAGLCLACELDGSGLKVALLESGDIAYSHKASQLANPAAGFRHGGQKVLESNRQVGGNASWWNIQSSKSIRTVRFAPYSEGDFQPKPWRDGIGWPFPRETLSPFYARAQSFMELPDIGFDPASYETNQVRRLPVDSTRIETAIFQFPDAAAISERRRDQILKSANVTIYTNATVQSLKASADGRRIEAARGVTDPGRPFTAEAREFVLCANGFGTPQILLSSDDVTPGGIGNAHDNVGRWYMNHPLVDGGDFIPSRPELFNEMALYDLRTHGDVDILGYFHITSEALRTEHLLNLCFMFFPAEEGYRENSRLSPRQSYGAYCALQIREALKYGRSIRMDQVVSALWGFDGLVKMGFDRFVNKRSLLRWNLGRGGWSAMGDLTRHYDRFGIVHLVEQAAHRDNRITLSAERDHLGARRYTVDWRLHKDDQEAIMRAQDVFGEEIRKAGLGTYIPLRDKGELSVISDSTGHIMGGTRMHDDPALGVVDSNCKVHGVANLHIASSSVFPSGGYANPTFTILALAIRLGDHLKAQQSAGRLAA
jgi:choline dehydrogenase-like flavoprotein